MSDYFGSLYEFQFKDVKKMSKEELQEELTKFRNLWTWVEDTVRYWLTHTRYTVRAVRRDYQAFKGVLGSVHFELKSIDIDVEDENFDWLKGTKTIEWKTVNIPINQLVDFEFIHEEEVVPIKEVEESEEELEEAGELKLDLGG